MIGLGGGVSSSFLSVLPEMDIQVRAFLYWQPASIQVETTVIELDPFMATTAEKYFGHANVPGVTNVIVADGLKFLKKAVKNSKSPARAA